MMSSPQAVAARRSSLLVVRMWIVKVVRRHAASHAKSNTKQSLRTNPSPAQCIAPSSMATKGHAVFEDLLESDSQACCFCTNVCSARGQCGFDALSLSIPTSPKLRGRLQLHFLCICLEGSDDLPTPAFLDSTRHLLSTPFDLQSPRSLPDLLVRATRRRSSTANNTTSATSDRPRPHQHCWRLR